MKLARLPLLLCLLGSAALGCGHPATREECEEILSISAAIALRADEVTDEVEVKQRTEDLRGLRGAELMQNCVGKRIPSGAMECMRAARTAEDFDACLD